MFYLVKSSAEVSRADRDNLCEGYVTQIDENAEVLKEFETQTEAIKTLRDTYPRTEILQSQGYGSNNCFYLVTEYSVQEENHDVLMFSKFPKSPVTLRELGLVPIGADEILKDKVLYENVGRFEAFLEDSLSYDFDLEEELEDFFTRFGEIHPLQDAEEIDENVYAFDLEDYVLQPLFTASKQPEIIFFECFIYFEGEDESDAHYHFVF